MRQQLCLWSHYVFRRSLRVLTVKRFSQLFLSRLIFLRIGKQLRPNYRKNLFTSYKPNSQHNYVTTTKTGKILFSANDSNWCFNNLKILSNKPHIWVDQIKFFTLISMKIDRFGYKFCLYFYNLMFDPSPTEPELNLQNNHQKNHNIFYVFLLMEISIKKI